MSSKTDICNLALSHLGSAKRIANVDSERSEEASACRQFYDLTRDTTLRAFPWPFTTRIRALDLVEEDPNTEWSFSYRLPSNCMMFRRILSGIRNDNRQSRVPTKIASDDEGVLVFSDMVDAEAEYTIKITDTEIYPSDFVMAMSLLLATMIAPRITNGDPYKLRAQNLSLYENAVSIAHSRATSEQQDEEVPDSEFIRVRE